MSALAAVDVAIGLVFAHLLFSLLCSRVNESIASLLQWRAQGLALGIRRLVIGERPPTSEVERRLARLASFEAPLLADLRLPRLWERRAVQAGRRQPSRLPSYLPSRTFALALMDALTGPAESPATAATAAGSAGSSSAGRRATRTRRRRADHAARGPSDPIPTARGGGGCRR